MKKLIRLFIFALCLVPFVGQAQITFSAPVAYTTGVPTGAPSGQGSRLRLDLLTGWLYEWSPVASAWVKQGDGIDRVSGLLSPVYAPGIGQSWFAINGANPPELYAYSGTGTTWTCMNCAGGGSVSSVNGLTGSVVLNLTRTGTTLSLTGGNSVSFSGWDTDVSDDFSGSWNDLTNVPAGFSDGIDNVDDADASPTNELQNLSLSGQSLGISSGTGVTLPVVSIAAGSGISVSTSSGVATVTNTGDTNAADDIASGTPAGGDLSGTYPDPTVDGLQGVAISSTSPTTGQVLKYNGTAWEPGTDATGGGSSDALGTGFTSGGGMGTLPDGTHAKIEAGSVVEFDYSDDTPAIKFDASGLAGKILMQSQDAAGVLTIDGSGVSMTTNGLARIAVGFDDLDTYGNFHIRQAVNFEPSLTPDIITSDQNDYYPTDIATTVVVRLRSDAERTITGLDNTGLDGKLYVLRNSGDYKITLANESGASGATTRFAIGSDYGILPGLSVMLLYDVQINRWTMVGANGTPTGAAGGDLYGSYPDPGVGSIRGYSVSSDAPQSENVLAWDANGENWAPVPLGGTVLTMTPITTTERDALTAEAGMMVFNSTVGKMQVYDGSTWHDLW